MLSEIEKVWVADLLNHLDLDVLLELSKSLTGGLITPSQFDDAVKTILQHSTDVISLLSKKKITKAVLFQYLHSKNVSLTSKADKSFLIKLLLEYWQKNTTFQTSNPPVQTASAECVVENITELDLKSLSVKFVEWFYNRINATVLHLKTCGNSGSTEKLVEDDFWCDAKLTIRVTNSTGELIADYACESSKDCLESISNFCVEHSIFFSPNLREDGTRGASEPHGMVLVMNCGTLHSTNGHQCVGLYEQVFGLIKEPLSDKWKIKFSRLNLRNQDVKAMPILPANNQPVCNN